GTDDLVAVEAGERQVTRDRTGGDQDVVAGDLVDLLADRDRGVRQRRLDLGLLDFDGALAAALATGQDLGVALDVVDLVLLEQEADALVELVGHAAAATDHLRPVHAQVV